jgi:hypothetical protein
MRHIGNTGLVDDDLEAQLREVVSKLVDGGGA